VVIFARVQPLSTAADMRRVTPPAARPLRVVVEIHPRAILRAYIITLPHPPG